MISKLLSLIFTIYFNFRYLPINQAIYLPIKINHKVKTKLKRGDIIINGKLQMFMIKFGFQGSNFIQYSTSTLSILSGGKLIFYGNCIFAEGCNIFINRGTLKIGNNVYANRSFTIQIENNSVIEDNVLIGWQVSIRDTDGHTINKNGINSKNSCPIIIKQNSWIAAQVTILKGTVISESSIVATGSIVTGIKLNEKGVMIAGIPAVIKRHNVERQN